MASKLRCEDLVVILTGKYKGKTGRIKFISSDGNKAIVQGINIVKKHQKGIPSKNISSGIIKKESFIHISNISIFNQDTKRSDRIGFKFISGKKVRFLKSNNMVIT